MPGIGAGFRYDLAGAKNGRLRRAGPNWDQGRLIKGAQRTAQISTALVFCVLDSLVNGFRLGLSRLAA
jgi:hypothetical protein